MKRRSFGNLRQLPSGRYQASYVDPNGQRRNAPDTFGTKKEADAWLADMRTKINRREWTEPETQGQTFREYATSWLLEKAHRLRPKTIKRYATLLDNHLFPYLGEYSMIEITPAEIRAWRAKLTDSFKRRIKSGNVPNRKTTGEATAADAYNLCHAIMQTAKRERVIYYNPCIIEGAGNVAVAERKPAELDELDIIANNMPDRYRALIYFAA